MVFTAQILAYVICIPAILFGTCFGLDLLLGGIAAGLRKAERS